MVFATTKRAKGLSPGFRMCPAQSSWSSIVPDHTVPYGTAVLGGVFPGTSCQATIAPSLRDNSQQALARCCCEMSASASRRDDTDRSLARSAWESVPRKNRPVGYGMIGYEGRLGRLSRALNRYGDLSPGWPSIRCASRRGLSDFGHFEKADALKCPYTRF